MKRRVKRRASTIPTASMGDIAFLLIIFFMVCSNFIKEASITLDPPRAEDLAGIEEYPVSVSIDEDGAMYLQGNKIANAEELEWGVRGLIADKATEKGQTVLFKCDASITRDVFESALDAIARGGGIIAAMGDKISGEEEVP